ncbi:MAG TPA: AraC family transcriptional regulator [Saprospiraceae bacterium]|nr:AraC family transcriptional regulator [Saprospiraceae bacterium]
MHYSRSILYVENMLSQRCKKIVETVLEDLGLEGACEIGAVTVDRGITLEQRQELKIILSKYGLKLLDIEKTEVIERMITLINERIYHVEQGGKCTFSDYLTENLSYDYNYLASLFSRIKGVTLENYIIAIKIDRVKELLLYDDCNLTEISYKLKYCSVAHLSTQFKKVTGITPSSFKCLTTMRVNPKGRCNSHEFI